MTKWTILEKMDQSRKTDQSRENESKRAIL